MDRLDALKRFLTPRTPETAKDKAVRREILKTWLAIGATMVVGIDIFSPQEVQAKNTIEVKKNGVKRRVIGTGENLNQIHTDVFNRFVSEIGRELKKGSYIMTNFRIKLSQSGKNFTLEYAIDLTQVDKMDPRIQDVFDIKGTIGKDKIKVRKDNQEKKEEWIRNNHGGNISHFWEEWAETECNGWYHQAVIFKAQSK